MIYLKNNGDIKNKVLDCMNATGKKIVEGLDLGHSMGIIHSTGGRTTNQLVDLARRGILKVVNPIEQVVYHA